MRPTLVALNDYLRPEDAPLPPRLARMIEEKRFAAIVLPLDGVRDKLFRFVERHYAPQGGPFEAPVGFLPSPAEFLLYLPRE